MLSRCISYLVFECKVTTFPLIHRFIFHATNGRLRNNHSFLSHIITTFANKTRTKVTYRLPHAAITTPTMSHPNSLSSLELRHAQEASLFTTSLSEWQGEAQLIDYGAIIICRQGKATIRINYKDWLLYRGAVITVFPNDVISLRISGSATEPDNQEPFAVEMLRYNASLLREASLQLEQTVYSALRQDRCRQDTPVVTNIIDSMFQLLHIYFGQAECTCLPSLVLCQLKAFFIGFHEYLQRNPQQRPDETGSYRVRELFNLFMQLMERNHKLSRDVNHYAQLMNITPKYLTNIVKQITGHTPKTIIDQYVTLQIKMRLHNSQQSIKEIAWEYQFADTSFFCRYFKKHTGKTPQQIRKEAYGKPLEKDEEHGTR